MCRHELSPVSGFGIDAYHGVCHANWLENVAALTSEGAFLGATALLKRMPEVRLYLEAVNDADMTTSHPASLTEVLCLRSKGASVIITATCGRGAARCLSTPS